MLGIGAERYHNYIEKRIKTDRDIVDKNKQIILKQTGDVCLIDYISDLLPEQPIQVEVDSRDTSFDSLRGIISTIESILSIQQAFYELMCEKKLMPVCVKSFHSPNNIDTTLNICFVSRDVSSIRRQNDTFDIPLLPFIHYIRVN